MVNAGKLCELFSDKGAKLKERGSVLAAGLRSLKEGLQQELNANQSRLSNLLVQAQAQTKEAE